MHESSSQNPNAGVGRERLLLDFGWRFHFGNADDPAKDFGFGSGRTGNFQKTGNFLPAGAIASTMATGEAVDLPHDWAVELPFQNDPALSSKGFYPLGRTYPATSVGWYRRVFDLPAADAGKRITIEFDGAYRETMVVFNGFYIGDAQRRIRSVQLRRDRLCEPGRQKCSAGARGCDLERWLVLRRRGNLPARLAGEDASGAREEMGHVRALPGASRRGHAFDPHGGEQPRQVCAERARDLDRARSLRQRRWEDSNGAAAIAEGRRADLRAADSREAARLWSLEERNLYRLVTEVEAGGEVVDRYETPFGIRTAKFDAQKGFFLNGKSVKLKGTCNHQDHAGMGAALPDAVQYYRIRKLQEMGCNSIRTSHNPPTPELLDACDELGMLVFDETRMMSSNPEGLSQFGDLMRRDRNRPSVFMWSMGNEEGQANTEKGVHILTAMKAVATEIRRLAAGVDRAYRRDRNRRPGGVRCDGLQLHGPAGGGISQGASRQAR